MEGGKLAQLMPGFRPRPQQKEMAQAILEAISQQKTLIAEAGTGTGKTFAYLIPTLCHGGKAIISTGTKTLQDQLFTKDIELIRSLFPKPINIVQLKGRANYVCHYFLERAAREGRFLRREDIEDLVKIQKYIKITKTGDKSDFPSIAEDAPIWSQVTSSRENCLGQDCTFYQDCFVLKARKAALEADVVVVNHHLFFADVWLKDEGNGELLPQCHTVIFDEAHRLPEIASTFFGNNITSGQLLELIRDSKMESFAYAKEENALPSAIDQLEKAIKDLRLVFKGEPTRFSNQTLQDHSEFQERLNCLREALNQVHILLKAQEGRSEGFKQLIRRAEELAQLLKNWGEIERERENVHWLEVGMQHFSLNATPLNIAQLFQSQMAVAKRAWIFVSATLAVDESFMHYQEALGLQHATTKLWPSPFDYKSQAILYVPKNMPLVNTPAFTRAVIKEALPLLSLTQGDAFLLFTSIKAMREGYAILRAELDRIGCSYPLLLQGQASRTALLERFRKEPHAILVASQTFWEGIDVKGDKLSLVVIDKLPFAAMEDPILAARLERIARTGGNGFIDYQLPQAVINLKQGAGRLIRDETDHGVLMIADTRLVEKAYGKAIWKSLPPMLRTREEAVVKKFWQQWALKKEKG